MTSPLRALLAGIVDYAGLFPPAGLDLGPAAANFARYAAGDQSWLLGRFVVPVSRLEALDDATPDGGSWRLSAIVGADVEAEFAAIRAYNDSARPHTIDMAEVKADSSAAIAHIATLAPDGVRVFVEVPAGDPDAVRELVGAVRAARLCAKIRTGGVTPDAFPAAADVAHFVRQCYAQGVAFKATAGLHHPLRSEHPLTYAEDAVCGVMHGFLNVFLTAAFCFNGLGVQDASRLMVLDDASALEFGEGAVRWEEYVLSVREIETARRRLCVSFGSCSFEEPVGDLRALNLL